MHEKIPIFILESNKTLLRDYLTEQNYSGGWDDWIYDKLKEIALNAKAMIIAGSLSTMNRQRVSFTESDIEKIKVKHDSSFTKDGVKSTFTVGPKMNEGLENSYKIQLFVNKKLDNKSNIGSFEKYINDQIEANVNKVLISSYDNELDKENKAIKEPKKKQK